MTSDSCAKKNRSLRNKEAAKADVPTTEVCRKHGIVGAISYIRKRKYAAIEVNDAKKLEIELQPKLRDTPLFGREDSPVEWMTLFRHPDLTPPRALFVGGEPCPE